MLALEQRVNYRYSVVNSLQGISEEWVNVRVKVQESVECRLQLSLTCTAVVASLFEAHRVWKRLPVRGHFRI